MHPADEFAHIKTQIAVLTERAQRLRQEFLQGSADLRSNAHEVVISRTSRRVFCPGRLPERLRADPALWQDRATTYVKVRAASSVEEEIELIERF